MIFKAVLLASLLNLFAEAFVSQRPTSTTLGTQSQSYDQQYRRPNQPLGFSSLEEQIQSSSELDIVLFGIGDLRVDDHEGLQKAIAKAGSKILPLVILDDKTLSNLPGAIAHTVDTASMIYHAVNGLKTKLATQNLHLHTITNVATISDALAELLPSDSESSNNKVRLHVCDLGAADNSIGYGAFSSVVDTLSSNIEVLSWNCNLRDEPWTTVATLPDKYPDFAGKFAFPPKEPSEGIATPVADGSTIKLSKDGSTMISAEDLCSRMQSVLGLDIEQCNMEKNTGMFSTHWGGLDASTVTEETVQRYLEVFVDVCGEKDSEFAKYLPSCKRNSLSLEHAVLSWNLKGDGKKGDPLLDNLIAGEGMTRYLAAPLFLGTISPRRIWHSAKKEAFLFTNPLKTLVEGREWHKLFAAHSMQDNESKKSGLKYKYFRWHGFLCRYGQSSKEGIADSTTKSGLLLVHGFGASATQWSKMIDSFMNKSQSTSQCLAPDLLGFGHSEKPGITYSGYTWESHVGDFIKEIAIGREGWQQYTIGGNSIGGFTAMCVAANDATVSGTAITGSGAPGSGKCTGVILMNPAGNIQSKEAADEIESAVTSQDSFLQSVAQVTALDKLPACKPLSRPLARAFGTGLLAYLRPRIQSICVNLYPTNPAAVDDQLCYDIMRDSLDPGAINVMISGGKLPPSRTYNELLAAEFGQPSDKSVEESIFQGPVLMPQGVLDPLNDAQGRSEMLGALRKGITIDPIQGGHCPHDEVPDVVASSIAKWLEDTEQERSNFSGRKVEEAVIA